jgi:hypothetical protein
MLVIFARDAEMLFAVNPARVLIKVDFDLQPFFIAAPFQHLIMVAE